MASFCAYTRDAVGRKAPQSHMADDLLDDTYAQFQLYFILKLHKTQEKIDDKMHKLNNKD